MVWDLQVFLARKNLSNAVEFAKDCVDAIGIEKLNTLEIGNEPDIYKSSGFFPNVTDRPSSYLPPDYVAEFLEFADALTGNLTLGAGPNFQALGYSNFVVDPWNEYAVIGRGDFTGLGLIGLQAKCIRSGALSGHCEIHLGTLVRRKPEAPTFSDKFC